MQSVSARAMAASAKVIGGEQSGRGAIYDGEGEPVEMKIEIEKEAAN